MKEKIIKFHVGLNINITIFAMPTNSISKDHCLKNYFENKHKNFPIKKKSKFITDLSMHNRQVYLILNTSISKRNVTFI